MLIRCSRIKFSADNRVQEIWIPMDSADRQASALSKDGSQMVRPHGSIHSNPPPELAANHESGVRKSNI